MFSLIFALALSSAAQSTAAAESSASIPPEKPICRREVRTGSNFATRICHTKTEWHAIDAANQAGAEQALRNRPPK